VYLRPAPLRLTLLLAGVLKDIHKILQKYTFLYHIHGDVTHHQQIKRMNTFLCSKNCNAQTKSTYNSDNAFIWLTIVKI
jgi:hypothetical protein